MKLSKLYSNQPEIFPPIQFRQGLNVVSARVTRPKDSEKDSHNLGKTLLLHLLDFMLLKNWEKGHFLHDNQKVFEGFVFFLEIETKDGYVTVRRSVAKQSKISIQTHRSRGQDFTALMDAKWTYDKLPFDRARQTLDECLNLQDLRPWDYRKGLGYALRAQGDYRDVFQLARFSMGKHKEWKPFMAHLLGLDYRPIEEKYEVEETILRKQQAKTDVEQVTGADAEAYDKLRGAIEIKRDEAVETKSAVERFDFYQQDLRLNSELVGEVETNISALNDRLYTIDYEVNKLTEALNSGMSFDLEGVERLFNEAQALFPDALRKGYEELLDFNRRLTNDRGKRLEDQLRRLQEERGVRTSALRQLNTRREELLDVVQDTDTLSKFRKLQGRLTVLESDIARMQEQLQQLDRVTQIEKEIREFEQKRAELVAKIGVVIREGSALYGRVKHEFNRILRTIIDLPALIATSVNSAGNVDFEALLLRDSAGRSATSEDKGTSYRHLMCCAFDMALLVAHQSGSFYRFVYHDGIFEGLDNRKKLKLLNIVRDVTDRLGMQHILTVIDSDMPRDDSDQIVSFREGEVVRELFEGDDRGRLFRMPRF